MVSTGKRIKARRIALGLTQQELATRLKTTRLRVIRLETGKTKVHLEWLPDIARALDTQPGMLLGTKERVVATRALRAG